METERKPQKTIGIVEDEGNRRKTNIIVIVGKQVL